MLMMRKHLLLSLILIFFSFNCIANGDLDNSKNNLQLASITLPTTRDGGENLGRNNMLCSDWSGDNQGMTYLDVEAITWLQGYYTAHTMFQVNSYNGMTPQILVKQVGLICNKNPDAKLTMATDAYIEWLSKNEKKLLTPEYEVYGYLKLTCGQIKDFHPVFTQNADQDLYQNTMNGFIDYAIKLSQHEVIKKKTLDIKGELIKSCSTTPSSVGSALILLNTVINAIPQKDDTENYNFKFPTENNIFCDNLKKDYQNSLATVVRQVKQS